MAQATIEVTGQTASDPLTAIEFCYRWGWTDGLHAAPPIDERIAAFLGYPGRERDEVLGRVSARRRIAEEQVVANAAMAGCLPEYDPVVAAVVEAMLQPAFNLVGPSASLGDRRFW